MATTNKQPNEKEVEKLITIFLKAETDIINEIGRLRSFGLVDYHAVAALERVQSILRKMQNDCWEYVPLMIEKQFYARVPEARKIIEPVEKHITAYEAAAELTAEQFLIIQRLTENLMAEITEASTTTMATLQSALLGRIESDIYRQVGLEVVAGMKATGKGAMATVPQFVDELIQNGVTAFIDKAGRKWSLHTYAAMVTRTTSRQAEVLAVLTADPEHDLYKISSHNTTCHICAPFEGRVYSKSGTSEHYPPLAVAFGKINPNGADDLSNTWLNIHPNCLHVLLPWSEKGRSEKEVEEMRKFSNPKTNPFTVDPRTQKQINAYRAKEKARADWLRNYRQWEKYRIALGNKCPKTFNTFMKHKKLDDEKYKEWQKLFHLTKSQNEFSKLIGETTVNGIKITSISKHLAERAVERKFNSTSALQALKNPLKLGKIKIENGEASQVFYGEKAAIVANPITGNLITGWRKGK